MSGAASPAARPDLLGLPLPKLAAELTGTVDRDFRARQVYDALHHRRVVDFDAMTDLPAALRARLAERFSVALPAISERRDSDDGTTKYLLRLADGASIEAVDIPERTRRTLCLSSQAGCGLACAFCVTGFWGAGRNLTAGEIVGQVRAARTGRAAAGELQPGLHGHGRAAAQPRCLARRARGPRRVAVAAADHGFDRGRRAGHRRARGLERGGRTSRSLCTRRTTSGATGSCRSTAPSRSPSSSPPCAAIRSSRGGGSRSNTSCSTGFNDHPADADALLPPAARRTGEGQSDPVQSRPRPARLDATSGRVADRGVPGAGSSSAALTVTVRRQRGHDVAAACGQLRAFARPARGSRARGARRPEAGPGPTPPAGHPGSGRRL